MNKTVVIIFGLVILLVAGFYALNGYIYKEKQGENTRMQSQNNIPNEAVKITPISHATMVLNWGGNIIYTDPVGGSQAFTGQPLPNIILVTDIHGDHFSTSTLAAISKSDTIIVAPQAVVDRLPKDLAGTVVMLKNGETTNQKGFSILAVPMYNVPETENSPHTKGRGNGYVIDLVGQRVYVAGDTGNTQEMRDLKNIDIAFVPMNLPYTMGVEDAAGAVLAFIPKRVIPYHYRGPDGLSDTNKFKQLVNTANGGIQVDLLNFYPTAN